MHFFPEAACTELQIQLVTESEVSQEAIERAKKFGVKFQNDPTDPKNYIIAFLKKPSSSARKVGGEGT